MKRISMMLIVILQLLVTLYADTEHIIEPRLSNPLEIGKKSLMFGSIAAVCEDDHANFYVLDKLEHKVFKFSPLGELQLSFGDEGEGPGDFQRPNRIAFTDNGEIVVADELYYLTYLKTDGTFIKRIDLNGRIVPGYIGPDAFYAWIWRPEDKQQILCDANNTVVRVFYSVAKKSFSVNIPDRSGRAVMFSYLRDEFAPALLFAHSGKYSAIAVTDKYEITLLNNEGQSLRMIKRNISPGRINKKERDYFAKDITEVGRYRGWPKSANRKLLKIIPEEKIFFDRILLTEHYVFVCRIKEDITKEESPTPIDIFSIEGKYIGATQIDLKPIHISDQYMYFVKSDEDENLFLVRMDYQLRK
ncbi:MAG: 6-bladed beta-propeller [Candidatus Aminicenantes bacterium]